MKSGDRQKTTEREGTRGMQTAVGGGGSKNKPVVNKKKEKPVKQLLILNTKIRTTDEKRLWCIRSHIGSGGFGDVYIVVDEKLKPPLQEFAMKTEVIGAHQRRLNVEKSILKEIDNWTTQHGKTRHFCQLIDAGQTREYLWIVMTLIGPSLDNVRRMLNKQFTKACVVNMAIQILDAVEMMHEVGFIHRDLKPGNICTGVPPQDDHILYVLDFGISRRIFKSHHNRELRNMRTKVPFYGTRKFCNRACHEEKDQGRKDDMETYVYTILDLFHNERGLSWSKDLQDTKKIIAKKKALFENPEKELDKMIPEGFAKIIRYLKDLKFADAIDYRYIEQELRSTKRNLISTSDPSDESMDWTGKLEKMLRETKKNKKVETPKGEETLIYERLQRAKREREMASSGGRSAQESSMMRTLTKEADGSEGPPAGFNERALTTVGATQEIKKAHPKVEKKKSRSRN